jgi:formate-dependent phosphoribosylglycinamide formyltransferase (GAR transformylase)
VIGHRGRKYSIFKNKKQIAFWQQEAITWLSGDNYRILANNDCNFELIIAFCLILDNANGGGNNIFTINIGHIGKEIKKFDQKWRPI